MGTNSFLPSYSHEREKCILIGVELRRKKTLLPGTEDGRSAYSAEESLEELAELANGAGAQVMGSTIQTRDKLDPATLIGRGKTDEVSGWAAEVNAGLVIFDQNLTPTQQRNLEAVLDRRVIDRTQLILDIFAGHARTREGRLQVELAQLSYLLPRLTGRGVELSRLGGGIGTRGPGETKLETDRRRIARRIEKLKTDLEAVRETRQLQRKKRSGVPLATVALVGYTNAGKSTLFNALTTADVVADARMFATLDPTIRVLEMPSRRRVLLSDTVGFISNLPPALIQSFRATLEEVTEAAMILHVVDVPSPHRSERMGQVAKILVELRAADKPQILVLNKTDLADPAEVAHRAQVEGAGGAVEVVAISAQERTGLAGLIGAIDRHLPGDDLAWVRFRFGHDESEKLSFLYDHARVTERADSDHGVEVVAEASESVRRRLSKNVVGEDPLSAATRKAASPSIVESAG